MEQTALSALEYDTPSKLSVYSHLSCEIKAAIKSQVSEQASKHADAEVELLFISLTEHLGQQIHKLIQTL